MEPTEQKPISLLPDRRDTPSAAPVAAQPPAQPQTGWPALQSTGQQPQSKRPPDQKTIDALLAVTRVQHEQEQVRKLADTSTLPKGLITGYIARTVRSFSPELLSSSSQARRRAIVTVVLLALSIVASVVLGAFLTPGGHH